MHQWFKNTFRWTDLALLIGFVIFVIFASYGQLYMYHQDPTDINLSLGVATLLFIAGLISYMLFIHGSCKKDGLPNKWATIIFIAVLAIGLISIHEAPNSFDFRDKATIVITDFSKVIFAFDFVMMMLFIYSALFIFSKRFKTYNFILFFSYLAYAFCLTVLIYSYITEFDRIINYFQVLFAYKEGSLTPAVSFIINSNSVGMVMLIGVLMAIVSHSIKPRWGHYPIAIFFYLNMSFTHCRGSLFLGTFAIIVFIFYRMIVSFKENKKRNTILLSVYSSLLIAAIVMVIVILALNGAFLPHLHHAISAITNTGTLNSRVEIYKISFAILEKGGWVIGKGFGPFNLILTYAVGPYAPYLVPAHNSFINILGNGGIVHLAAYIALLAYTVYINIKVFKKSPKIAFGLALSTLSYFIYTFIETIQYILYLYIFLLFVVYDIQKKNEAKLSEISQ